MILCQEVELCASLRRYYPVQVMRVRRKFPARLSHRMNHASAPLAKDMKLNVRSYSTILYRNVNIKKRPAALAAGRLSSYYRIR